MGRGLDQSLLPARPGPFLRPFPSPSHQHGGVELGRELQAEGADGDDTLCPTTKAQVGKGLIQQLCT